MEKVAGRLRHFFYGYLEQCFGLIGRILRMQTLSLISGSLTALYGILNTFAGISQLKAGMIQPWSAWCMMISGLLLIASGVMLVFNLPLAIPLLVIGLIAIHLLTINNGLHMHGKIKPGHHLLRLAFSLILFGLAYWSR